jgi:hypothetical protein
VCGPANQKIHKPHARALVRDAAHAGEAAVDALKSGVDRMKEGSILADPPEDRRLLDDDQMDELAVLLHGFITTPTFHGKQRIVEGSRAATTTICARR